MTLLYTERKQPLEWPVNDAIDFSDKKYFYILYRPVAWATATLYKAGESYVTPTTANGFYYVCSVTGTSGATEPTFATTEDATTADGTAVWVTIPDTLPLRQGDAITTSTWGGPTGTTTDNAAIVGTTATKVRVTAIPAGVDTVTITNHVTVTRASTDVEEWDVSIAIPVASL